MTIGGYEWVTTASIGVVLSSSASERPEYLLRSADMAMYRAKHQGGALSCMTGHVQALHQVTETGCDARSARGVRVHYQPSCRWWMAAHQGEALIRWRHGERAVAPNVHPGRRGTGSSQIGGRCPPRVTEPLGAQLGAPPTSPGGQPLGASLAARLVSRGRRPVVRRLYTVDSPGDHGHDLQPANVALQTVAEKALGYIHIDDFDRVPCLPAAPAGRCDQISSLRPGHRDEPRSRHVVRNLVSSRRASASKRSPRAWPARARWTSAHCAAPCPGCFGKPAPGTELVQSLVRQGRPDDGDL
jgi:hypothetical protein